VLRLLALAIVTLVLAAPRSADARGGFLPPLEVQYGGTVTGAPGGDTTFASQLLVGLSWASLYPNPTPVDISAGVIANFELESDAMPVSARSTTPTQDPPSTTTVGGYLHVARTLESQKHFRVWLGTRGELMSSNGVGVLGGALRTSVELWSGTTMGGHGGGIMGTVALAVWAEVGVREQSDRSVASFAGAGLGIRLPLVAVN